MQLTITQGTRSPAPRLQSIMPKLARQVFVGAVALLLSASIPVDLDAQVTTSGQIRGRIVDEGGQPVAGAVVTARNVETGFQREAQSSNDGLYVVRLLPPGTYVVEVRMIGFQPRAAADIAVTIGNATPVNLDLTRAAVQLDEIMVTAEAAQIDLSEGGVKQLVTRTQIEELPSLGRDFVDFVDLSGLVSTDPGETTGGQFSIAGQRASQTSIQIDGVDANNSFFGENRGGSRIPFSFSLESIREFQIITNGFDVEFGRFSGGIVNVVTQGGTNDFEATVYGNFRSDALTSDPFIVDPNDPEITTDYEVQQFAARVSGPIVRDKAFFLISADGQRRREPQLPLSLARFQPGGENEDAAVASDLQRYFDILQSQYGVTDAASGYRPFETTNDEIVLFGRLDWNLNENHRVSTRVNFQDFNNDNEWNGNFDFDYGLSRAELLEDRAVSWVTELQSTLSPTSFNVLRFQIADEKRPRQGKDLRPTLTVNLAGNQQARYGGTFASFNNNLEETKFQLIDNFTKVMGDHTIKVGGNLLYTQILNQFQNFGSQFQGAGEFRFANLDDFEAFRPSSYFRPIQLGGGVPTSRFDVIEWAVYGQDTWQVTRKLAATLGLRYDLQSFRDSPQPVVDVERAFGFTTGFAPTDKNNISPRLSFTYDLRGDGESVLRGGVGYFYGTVPLVVGGNVLQTELPVLEVICNGSIADGDPDAPPSPSGYTGWSIDGANNPATCDDVGAGGVPTYTVWNENFAFPESFQANVGYETLLSERTRVGVDFVFTQSRNLYTVRNLNLRDSQFTLTAEGGRRVFTPPELFNPSGSNSTGARRNLEFGDVLVNFNDGRSRSFIGKAEISHAFNRDFQVRGEYTYNSTFDNSPYSCCTAGGGYADPTTGVFGPNEIGDVGDTDNAWGRSDFSREHTIVGTALLRVPLATFGDLRLAAFWKSQSGRPWTVIGDDDLNGDGLTGNDRAFIFSAQNLPLASAGTAGEADERAAYGELLNTYSCVSKHVGTLIPRGTCRFPWRHQLDVRMTMGVDNIFGPGAELSVEFFNVLNGIGTVFCDKEAADFDATKGACGWGRVTGVFGSNREILDPRGFDPTTGQIQYAVNRRFGQEDLLGSNLVLQFQTQVGLRLFF